MSAADARPEARSGDGSAGTRPVDGAATALDLSVEGLRVEALDEGRIWRATLATPKANIIDQPKVEALTRVFERAAGERHLKAIVLGADGPHFSFGASVEEHRPEACAGMLARFHAMFGKLLDAQVTVLAAVRGQCLGGGLELAAVCHRVVAAPDARLGQPEIVLGVTAPVGSVALPERVGRGAAEDLLLSGRSVGADEALAMGLVDQLADDPDAAALAWVREHLMPRSASSLRHAVRAARLGYGRRFRAELAELERMYLQDLMSSADAHEGLTAFLEKRPPVWSDA